MLQENIKAIKIAVQLCNRSDVKEIIINTPEPRWQKTLNKKAKDIIKELNLSQEIEQEVAGMVKPIAQRILIWARYHKDVFYLPNDYTTKFLNDTFFTEQGIIDSEKVAIEIIEKLVKDENLMPIPHLRYKLACVYCLEKDIPILWKQLTKTQKEFFYNAEEQMKIKEQELVKFWSCYLNGVIDKLKGKMSTRQYKFKKAIENCSEVAVKYYWPKLDPSARGKIVKFAMQVLKYKDEPRYKCTSYRIFPVECFDDLLYFLISEMKEEQKIEFFKNDIKEAGYSRILNLFLGWPYQDSFMEAANLMWGTLSGKNYANLLLRIIHRSAGNKEKIKNDYRKLFKEFWSQSPDEYKRYILSGGRKHVPLKYLFLKPFKLRKITSSTYQKRFTSIIDKKNIELIELILNDATPEEKEIIISFSEWKLLFGKIMIQEKWELLEELVNKSTSSTEGANQFKRGFTSSWIISQYLIEQDNFALIDKIEKWSLRSEEEIAESKKKLVLSDMAEEKCRDLIVEGKLELANKFVKWGLKSEEEIKEFKKKLIHNRGNNIFYSLISDLELIDNFVKWGLESEEEIKEFKNKFAFNKGSSICRSLIAESEVEFLYDQGIPINRTIKFYGGQWERVEMFLTWAFSSEEKICEFKKELFEASGAAIHCSLIIANRWEEAETFFAWLELSKQEIKELKKENLFYERMLGMFGKLVFRKDDDLEFLIYGGRQQAIDLFLRWHLIDIDKESILKFRDNFRHQFDPIDITEKYEMAFKDFDLKIEQCLSDLTEDEKGVKRKNEALDLPRKKLQH